MKKVTTAVLAAGLVVGGIGTLALLPGESGQSADHLDPPARTNPDVDSTPDAAADMGDVYAWAEDDNLNLVMTFAGPAPVDEAAVYDRDVLYEFFVSTDGDPLNSEAVIDVRFGRDGADNVGVQARGIPGAGTIAGPVETELSQNGVRLQAGLFDDPFFFDSQGFRETVMTGTIRFDNERDFFANANITAIVVQIPLANLNASGNIAVWGATSRFGGQL